MGSKVSEIVGVLIAIMWCCIGFEDNSKGADKKKNVVDKITEAIDSPEGLHIAPGIWRDSIVKVLPLGVNFAVMFLNRFSVFSKSS